MIQRALLGWRRATLHAALAAAFCTTLPAHAGDVTLDFDDVGYGFLGAGDSFDYKGLQLTAASGLGDAEPGDLVGAVFDGNDPGMCMRLSCPVDNHTPGYYAGLNDGALVVSGQNAGLQIKSFDASFIGAFERNGIIQFYPEVAGLLEVRGFAADGSYLSVRFALKGPYPYGTDFYMAHFETSAAFASQTFTSLAFFAYSCDFDGNCAAFHDNAGQFALDNLQLGVSAVPEPSTALMLLGGLGAIAAVRRRRSA